MSLVINTNISSLNSQRNLSKSQNSLKTSLERLSSGLRINSAKDDAAGLAISDRMTSQIRGLNQASRNANDGISLAQTAEGAMREDVNILQRIRELAVQSANDTNSTTDRASLQAEVDQLKSEINQIANNTTFNGKNIIDGSFANKQFQVGANSSETISMSIDSMHTCDLCRYTMTAINNHWSHQGTGNVAAASVPGGYEGGFDIPTVNTIDTQNVTINGTKGSAIINIVRPTSSKANQIADMINEKSGETGVKAIARNSMIIGRLSANGTISMEIGPNRTTVTATVTTDNLSMMAAAINKISNTTKVTATSSGGLLTMYQDSGQDLVIGNFTHLDQAGACIYATGLAFPDINSIEVPKLISGGRDSNRAAGIIELYSDKAFSAFSDINGSTVFAKNSGEFTFSEKQSVADIDISTINGAYDAIEISDVALNIIDSQRGYLGAIQNRFESTISNLQNISENLSAARSRIMDTDIPLETSVMTKHNILQEAGVAILSQANMQPQLVLRLFEE